MKPADALPKQQAFKRSRKALRVTTLLLTICSLSLAHVVQAKRHHSHPNAYHVIKTVNEKTQTVTIGTEHSKDHSEKALKVNGFTEITVDGLKATLHDLHPGMMVQVDEDADNVAAALDAQHTNKK